MGERMYYILKIIQESEYESVTAKKIVEELEKHGIYIDIKTVYSSIKNINAFFYPLLNEEMIVSRKKIGFHIENEIFSDGQLQFLLDSVTFHEDLNFEDKKELKDKLKKLSSKNQRQRMIDFQSQDKKQTFSLILNLSTIMKAIDQENVLSFQYINYKIQDQNLIEISSPHGNQGYQYIVSPYQIVSQNNHYYLIGYNQKYKNQLSIYRIDRMRHIQTIHQHFIEIREQFNMSEEIEKMTNMYTTLKKDTLVIECHYQLLREIVSHFGTDFIVEKSNQDHYKITIHDVSISDGLIGWLFMLQSHIKVLLPLSLKEEMKKRIEKMKSLYQDMI